MNLTQFLVLTLLVCVSTTLALTSSQISSFYNNVTFNSTQYTNNYVFYSTGYPDHKWTKVNPNVPTVQNYAIKIPKNPTKATSKTCVPMGIIGFTLNGVALFNPFTSEGYDAVTGANKELFDSCNGHATNQGIYHYHQNPNCVAKGTLDEFLGVALDGYPIYGANSSNFPSRLLTNADLDVCHGLTNTATGKYRYHITGKYPYILGCYMGTPISPQSTIRIDKSTDCSNATRNDCCGCPIGPEPRPPNGVSISQMSGTLAAIWAIFMVLFWLN